MFFFRKLQYQDKSVRWKMYVVSRLGLHRSRWSYRWVQLITRKSRLIAIYLTKKCHTLQYIIGPPIAQITAYIFNRIVLIIRCNVPKFISIQSCINISPCSKVFSNTPQRFSMRQHGQNGSNSRGEQSCLGLFFRGSFFGPHNCDRGLLKTALHLSGINSIY